MNQPSDQHTSLGWLNALPIVAIAVLAVAAVVGFFSTNRLMPDESEPLIQDLPVIENVDKYLLVEDIEYLRALQKSDLFHESEGLPEP